MGDLSTSRSDAFVVGAGPNGLAAAVRLAMEGVRVTVIERGATVGGGTRTMELLQEGYRHDVCSAIHPMALASPFFRALDLESNGVQWVHAESPAAHPLDRGAGAVLRGSLLETAEAFTAPDREAYHRLFDPIVRGWPELREDLLGPLKIPGYPFRLARFGVHALRPATQLVRRFKAEEPKALFAGLAAHSMLSLGEWSTSAIGLVLGAAGHAGGWPFPKGGSQAIADALVAILRRHGGEVITGVEVSDRRELPMGRAVLLDTTPRQVLDFLGPLAPARWASRMRAFRYGLGSFKLDYILSEPVPWTHVGSLGAGTVHLGGTFAEIAASEAEATRGRHSDRPYVLVAQPSRFDRTRVPGTGETLWAYCHVPHGSDRDMTRAIEDQIERYAPGFRDTIVARRAMGPADLQAYNPNYVGGDINGGRQDLLQLFNRPVSLSTPYDTPVDGVYMCSSSTPPGGGVHGMCGFHAAERVLAKEFGFTRKALAARFQSGARTDSAS